MSNAALALLPPEETTRDFAAQLQELTTACRLRHERLGTRRALTRGQLEEVADRFSADRRSLSGTKRLLDTSDPAFRAVGRVHAEAAHYWRSVTVPFPEPGVRLIRRTEVAAFHARMAQFQVALADAVSGLQRKYAELRERARTTLGTLFSEADYPTRVDEAFAIEWDYPSYEPPRYLRQLHPQLYEQECDRIRTRFEEAVRLTERAFLARLHELVSHLAERLSGEDDGRPKIFRNSAVANLTTFFEEFRRLDLGSSAELNALVDRAQALIRGVTPDSLRGDRDTRAVVADGLADLQAAMDALIVPRPTRAIRLVED